MTRFLDVYTVHVFCRGTHDFTLSGAVLMTTHRVVAIRLLTSHSIEPQISIAQDAIFNDCWDTEFEEHPGPGTERYGSTEGARILSHALNVSTDSGQLNGTGVHLWTIANTYLNLSPRHF
jgi:hypothetical protein